MSTHVPATVEGVLLFINTHKTKSEAEGLSAIYSFPVSDSAYPHVPQNIYGRLSSASSFPSSFSKTSPAIVLFIASRSSGKFHYYLSFPLNCKYKSPILVTASGH
jgi:hypothetical protein